MNNNFSEEILTRSLKTSPEIKILICHILNKFNISLNRQEIVSILQEGDIANYFEINSAIKQLVDDKNIKNLGNNSNIYKITSTGKIIAEQLGIAVDEVQPDSYFVKDLGAELSEREAKAMPTVSASIEVAMPWTMRTPKPKPFTISSSSS